MSTNYYACRKFSKDNKEKAIQLLNNDKYNELVDFINENCLKVHIGKQSYGWQFLFNYNKFKYYDLNKESIKKFLSECEIVDEYNRTISYEEFWSMVESNSDKLNYRIYYEKEPMLPFMILDEVVPMELKKYNVELGEFYSDGLRFSSSTRFS
ncbi:MAG: hypothetical protein IKT40_07435 [Bacilli bacterium]|nr:hypothetical protein [Bacilli bacterium]